MTLQAASKAVRLTPSTLKVVKRLADVERRSISSMVETLIHEALEQRAHIKRFAETLKR